MAVFLINICKFNDCGLIFERLADLIQHIEDCHIDSDPKKIEEKEHQKPTCLPLSYVLRFYFDGSRKENVNIKPKTKPISTSNVPIIQNSRYVLPRGKTLVGEEPTGGGDDSNDSWATTEEFSSEFILRYGSRMLSPNASTNVDKPFACPVPGCKKRYKNVNGIKYHSKNGHKNDGRIRKGYKCHCGKSYKSSHSLQNHTLLFHNSDLPPLGGHSSKVSQLSPRVTLQPVRTLMLKQINNLNGAPIKTLVVKTVNSLNNPSPHHNNLSNMKPALKISTNSVSQVLKSSPSIAPLSSILTPASSPCSSTSSVNSSYDISDDEPSSSSTSAPPSPLPSYYHSYF
ncbi:juxtaposed with another zinc finger protein 1 isoform X2 [Bemisia tabaci]|uniref:juxtaposed with another zinc finger protein 1 isoform X2 n=1 Tax=Bemisia tabaci TaxID=7038 RepID=UPI0008F9C66C|nr:PREDICTED: juxtaposed with another zinc finger protein 1 isoform X2 [Bemisia tabaci]